MKLHLRCVTGFWIRLWYMYQLFKIDRIFWNIHNLENIICQNFILPASLISDWLINWTCITTGKSLRHFWTFCNLSIFKKTNAPFIMKYLTKTNYSRLFNSRVANYNFNVFEISPCQVKSVDSLLWSDMQNL